MISWRVRQVLFVLMVVFIAWVEGFTNPFWIWNAVPIAISYLMLSRARQKNSNPLPAIAFFVVACGTVLFAHAAWLYDWNEIKSGSSTAGLLFIMLPVFACGLGAAAFALQALLLKRRSS
ncbi:MAG: hypothetical protein R3192_08925 [Woeseiaceae bacterium]|nr:hypothetical protein [Woeseiaceae bacterium]